MKECKNRLSIGFLTFEFGEKLAGGLGRIVTSLGKGLASKGHNVFVFLPFGANSVDKFIFVRKIDLAGLPYQIEIFRDEIISNLFLVILRGGSFDQAAFYPQPADLLETQKAFELGNLVGFCLSKFKIDILHIHDMHGFGVIPHAKMQNIPIVYTVHVLHKITPILHYWENFCCREADIVTTVSQKYLDENREFFEQSTNGSHVIHNFVDDFFDVISESEKKEKKNRFLESSKLCGDWNVAYLGRLDHYQKGTDLFAQLARSVLQKTNQINFLVGGVGWMDVTSQLKKLEDEYPRNFKFINTFLPKEEVKELLRIADISVIPSYFEPFGIIQLESLTQKSIPVVSDVGGLPEVNSFFIDQNKFRFIFKNRDLDDFEKTLFNTILALEANPFIDNILPDFDKKIKKYQTENVADLYVQLYQMVLCEK